MVMHVDAVAAWRLQGLPGSRRRGLGVPQRIGLRVRRSYFRDGPGRGVVSRTLNTPVLIFLGEISYSCYLVHQILLNVYRAHAGSLPQVPNAVAYGVFLVVLLIVSYLMWAWIEMPGRQFLLGNSKIHNASTVPGSRPAPGILRQRPALAAAALVGIVLVLRFTSPGVATEPGVATSRAQDSAAITPAGLASYRGTTFGGKFTLVELDVQCRNEGLVLQTTWRREGRMDVAYATAVHLTDSGGRILGTFDRRSKAQLDDPKAGHTWSDSIVIPLHRISGDASQIGVGLYDDGERLLSIAHPRTDWDGRRLLIEIARCPA